MPAAPTDAIPNADTNPNANEHAAATPGPSKPFVHLHCHSHYSLLDGAGDIGKLVQRTVDHGMNALALTDHGNLHGALEFLPQGERRGDQPDHRL